MGRTLSALRTQTRMSGVVIPVSLSYNEAGAALNGAQYSALGEPSVSQNQAHMQGSFTYGTNAYVHETFTAGGGAISTVNGQLQLSIGTTNGAYAVVRTKDYLQTKPGAGTVGRLSAVFGAPAANLLQRAGFASIENALGFGYNGTSFGVVRRTGGRVEIVTLTVTGTGAGGNITITLSGLAGTTNYVVAMAGASTTAADAAKIANDAQFNGAASLWDAEAIGSTVVFSKRFVDAVNGTPAYSQGATGTTATIARTRAGAAHTDTWTPQSSWNIDKMDGTGRSGLALDPSKGNIYSIKYSGMGYGAVVFAISSPTTGLLQEVHRIQGANMHTTPLIEFPTMQLEFGLASLGSTSACTMSAHSYYGANTGNYITNAVIRAFSGSRQVTAGTPLQLFSIRPMKVYNSALNKGEAHLQSISFSSSSGGTRTGSIALLLNGTPASTQFWSQLDSNSFVSTDTTSLNVTGGIQVFGGSLPANGSLVFNLAALELTLIRNDVLSVVATSSSGTIDFAATLCWHEDQ